MVVAFFGNCGSGLEASSSFRWKLIISLLETPAGVFASNSGGESVIDLSAPPSAAHGKAIVRELRHLCSLLSNGALDPLQADNAIIIRIFQSCVHLEHNEWACYKYVQPISRLVELNRENRKAVIDLWKESDIHCHADTFHAGKQLRAAISDFSSFHLGYRSNDILSLSSDSVLVRAALNTIKLWILRHPDKRARWLRLNDSLHVMTKMCEDLVNKTALAKDTDLGHLDEFKTIFSGVNCALSQCAASSFAREATAYLLLCVAQTWFERLPSSQEANPLIAKIDKSLCKRIWTLVANQGMIIAQESIYNQRIYERANANRSLQEVFSATKVMMLLTLLQLKTFTNTDLIGTLDGHLDSLEFLITCLLACFGAASESIPVTCQKDQSFFCTMVVFLCSYWLNVVVNHLAYVHKFIPSTHSKRIVAMILPAAQEVISKLLQVADPGKLIDAAFRCCLSLIRSSIYLLYGKSHRPISPVNAHIDSAMNVIDDEVLMSIDIDALICEGSSRRPLNAYCQSLNTDTLLELDRHVTAFILNLIKYFLSLLMSSTVREK